MSNIINKEFKEVGEVKELKRDDLTLLDEKLKNIAYKISDVIENFGKKRANCDWLFVEPRIFDWSWDMFWVHSNHRILVEIVNKLEKKEFKLFSDLYIKKKEVSFYKVKFDDIDFDLLALSPLEEKMKRYILEKAVDLLDFNIKKKFLYDFFETLGDKFYDAMLEVDPLTFLYSN